MRKAGARSLLASADTVYAQVQTHFLDEAAPRIRMMTRGSDLGADVYLRRDGKPLLGRNAFAAIVVRTIGKIGSFPKGYSSRSVRLF